MTVRRVASAVDRPVTAALVALALMAGSACARAQTDDHFSLAITGQKQGAFRNRLAGLAFNQVGATRFEMTFAWGPEMPQLFAAITNLELLTTARAEFVHGTGTQPYYTVTLQNAQLAALTVAYDSVAGSWLETLTLVAPQVSYQTPAATPAAVRATTARAPAASAMAPRVMPRIVMTPRRLTMRAAESPREAGTPTSAYATLVGPSGPFTVESPLAQANHATNAITAFTLRVTRPITADGTVKPAVTVASLTFTKHSGAASTDIQSAFSHGTALSGVTFDFLDGSAGRHAYRVQLAPARVTAVQTSFANGAARDSVKLSFAKITVSNLIDQVTHSFDLGSMAAHP